MIRQAVHVPNLIVNVFDIKEALKSSRRRSKLLAYYGIRMVVRCEY